jgi:Flp pilus assembly protein TadG
VIKAHAEQPKQKSPRRQKQPSAGRFHGRRGIVTLWTVLVIPFVLAIFCALLEVGHLWQGRVQFEDAMQAAALASVQEWEERGGKAEQVAAAECQGKQYALANTLHGVRIDLDNRAIVPAVAWAFGTAALRGDGFDFCENTNAGSDLTVVLQATARVPPLFAPIFGGWIADPTVTVRTAAYYDRRAMPPRPRVIPLNY